jgi:hypothetical protein
MRSLAVISSVDATQERRQSQAETHHVHHILSTLWLPLYVIGEMHVAQGRREAAYDEVRYRSVELSFWAGSPLEGDKFSSIIRRGPAILTAPTSSNCGTAIFSMTSNVFPSNILISWSAWIWL